jgi:hypothetical protein
MQMPDLRSLPTNENPGSVDKLRSGKIDIRDSSSTKYKIRVRRYLYALSISLDAVIGLA